MPDSSVETIKMRMHQAQSQLPNPPVIRMFHVKHYQRDFGSTESLLHLVSPQRAKLVLNPTFQVENAL